MLPEEYAFEIRSLPGRLASTLLTTGQHGACQVGWQSFSFGFSAALGTRLLLYISVLIWTQIRRPPTGPACARACPRVSQRNYVAAEPRHHAVLVGKPESDLRPGDGWRIPLVTEARQEQRTGREASTRESSEPVNYEVLINASHGVVSLIISGLEPSCYATLGISEPGILSFEPHLGHDIRTS